ncbi:phage baseplate assembly protein, partial [Kingella kingae]
MCSVCWQFGFTSHAPADSDVIVVPLGGVT